MIDSIEHLVKILKAAREKKGLSQRALSAKVRIPQSHISKIEKGEVDLHTSSLIELARTLELELVLIPRQLIPIVKRLQRDDEPRIYALDQKTYEYMTKHLEKIRKQAVKLGKQFPHFEIFTKLVSTIRELQYLQFNPSQIASINKIIKQLQPLLGIKSLQNEQSVSLSKKLEENMLQINQLIRYLTNIHNAHMQDKQDEPIPLYQLDPEEDHDV